ncbi:MAG: acyl-CoA dehydrogenase family protein [Chloroflexi bacterium]|nr:acyl-CoA dehydrogenase family protein [Chloroflexota bacterium]
MDFAFTPQEEAFRQDVRRWLQQTLTSAFWEEIGDEVLDGDHAWSPRFSKLLAQQGWLLIPWPKEYGGMGATPIQLLVFCEEIAYQRAPIGAHRRGVFYAAPSLMLFGTEENKREFLPQIARGEGYFCWGLSEPNAGSDLANVQTHAEEDGDDFVINGQKVWTSDAHRADYCWLLCRTDPNVPKHQGLSIIAVPMKTPGVRVRPLINIVSRHHFNEVFFDNVRVPKKNIVGQKNRGWYQIAASLDFERAGIGIMRPVGFQRTLDDLTLYIREHGWQGVSEHRRLLHRHSLAEAAIEIQALKLLLYRVTWLVSKGQVPNVEASMGKAFGDDLAKRLANLGMTALGLYGQLPHGTRWAPLRGFIEHYYLQTVSAGIAGGTSEVQRNVVAQRGLGLPRS